MQLAPQSVDKLQNAAGFRFDDGLHHQLATAVEHGDYNRFLVHVHSDIFDVVTHLSCLLGGKDHVPTLVFPSKVKCHSPAALPMLSCGSFPPRTLLQLLSSAAVAEQSPAQRSTAEAAPHPASTSRSGALFHNALRWF